MTNKHFSKHRWYLRNFLAVGEHLFPSLISVLTMSQWVNDSIKIANYIPLITNKVVTSELPTISLCWTAACAELKVSVTRGNRGSLELSSVVISQSPLLKRRVLAVRQLPIQLHDLSKKVEALFWRTSPILSMRSHVFPGYTAFPIWGKGGDGETEVSGFSGGLDGI